jgi:hypothetical protein
MISGDDSPNQSLAPITLDVLILIWSIKYGLVTKLIAQIATNLRDESIKPN